MNNTFQERFAQRIYTPQKNAEVRANLEAAFGTAIDFRIMEAPLFCTPELRDKVARAARELVMQCVEPEFVNRMDAFVPASAKVPGRAPRPLFSVVDFALSSVNGSIVPRLIELQGFPSLFGYQLMLAEELLSVYHINAASLAERTPEWSPMFSDISCADYRELLRSVICGNHHPDNVALTEIHPHKQKTRVDFIATDQITGVAATDICSLVRVDHTLFHERGGALHPVRRIYNRAIVDEINDENIRLPFSWNDELSVEWAGHPDWYFLMSKAALPYLHHECVPQTDIIASLKQLPADLSQYVLKPLFAFAGKGVIVSPTQADIEAIPAHEQSSWVLMEKVDYARCMYTPLGMNAVELRCMLIWPESSPQPIPTMSLVRCGRGTMMGARYNTDEWTGATVALFGDSH
jgi:hypothetical protein